MNTASVEYDWEKDSYYRESHLRLKLVSRLVAGTGARRVLDVGCGAGRLGELLDGVEYCGCDNYYDEAPFAGGRYQAWRCDDSAPELPFGGEKFDAIVCSGFLEYIRNHRGFFRCVRERLNDGGHVVVSMVNPWYPRWVAGRLNFPPRWLANRLSLPRGFWHSSWCNTRHQQFLVRDLRREGFKPQLAVQVPLGDDSWQCADLVLAKARRLDAPGSLGWFDISVPQKLFLARKESAECTVQG